MRTGLSILAPFLSPQQSSPWCSARTESYCTFPITGFLCALGSHQGLPPTAGIRLQGFLTTPLGAIEFIHSHHQNANIKAFGTGRGKAGRQGPTFPIEVYPQGFAHVSSPKASLFGVQIGGGGGLGDPINPESQSPGGFQQEWAERDFWVPSQQIPKFPSLSFPEGATLLGPLERGPPGTKLPALGTAGGRVRTSALRVLHPAPQTSPERRSRGTHRRGLRRCWGAGSAVLAPLVWALAGAEAGLPRGSGSALALGGAARGPPLVPPPDSGKPHPHPPP